MHGMRAHMHAHNMRERERERERERAMTVEEKCDSTHLRIIR